MMTGGRTQPRLLLAALGNPLLDIIVRDEEERLVRSHNLERKVAQEVDTLATGLYDEVLAMPGVVTAGGGCSLNTARVFSWLAGAGHRDSCVFIGCVGEDERAAGERHVSTHHRHVLPRAAQVCGGCCSRSTCPRVSVWSPASPRATASPWSRW